MKQGKGISVDLLIPEADGQISIEAQGKVPDVRPPTRSARGILAKYGTAPSAEDIAQNRKEMFANFPRDAQPMKTGMLVELPLIRLPNGSKVDLTGFDFDDLPT